MEASWILIIVLAVGGVIGFAILFMLIVMLFRWLSKSFRA